MNNKYIKKVKIAQKMLLIIAVICFVIGVTLAFKARKDRLLDSTHFQVEVLSKTNVEQGYYDYTYEYVYKVQNNSGYSIKGLGGDIRIYNSAGELLSAGTLNLDFSIPLESQKSSTWTVTTKLSSGEAATEIWNMNFSEMEMEFRL